MIGEWAQPFDLFTEFGHLLFNQPLASGSLQWLQMAPTKCSCGLPVRLTDDDVPQGDGKISHRRWRSGYQMHWAFEPILWDGSTTKPAEPACDPDLQEMLDLVGLHVNELIRTGQIGGANARFFWTPDTMTERMLDRVQLVSYTVTPGGGELGGYLIEVDVDSTFPYYMEANETDVTVADGATETVTNAGNVDYLPVVEVYGPFDGFTLTNHSVQDIDGADIALVYDSTLPGGDAVGGGDWIEFEFFRETAYLNGNVSSRKGSIDWRASDFFPLIPGANSIELAITGGGGGGYAVIRSAGAWA
jgi:hypothetical protein